MTRLSSSAAAPAARVVRLYEIDNVVVATGPLAMGETIEVPSSEASASLACRDAVPPGHKLATVDIAAGERVLKYGNPIGVASTAIRAGEHVHSHNLVDENTPPSGVVAGSAIGPVRAATQREFLGFERGDGRVGTRNYVLVASRVNCSATVCHEVARRFPPERLAEFPRVDGLAIATHTTGCGLQYGGLKHAMLGRVLHGYATHANVGGCLMIGLGCEQTTDDYLRDEHGLVQISPRSGTAVTESCSGPPTTTTLTIQAEGGTRATIDRAERCVLELLERANQARRTIVNARHLKVALECGGSDGYSGWTANPAVGEVADRVVACGGAAVISETTELAGAEHLLVARSVNEAVATKLLGKIQWWRDHVAMYGGCLDHNPSIGNKAGGLTTITEKSLGAVAKSGSGAVVDVLDYAHPVPDSGLVVMDSPGFDPSSVTGKVAGGCNLVLFTTGRGSCFGNKPVPVIKIASNSVLFNSMSDDMDFDAGRLLHGERLSDLGDEFFEFLLRVASGQRTCSERLGLGDHEFVPWTVGPTL